MYYKNIKTDLNNNLNDLEKKFSESNYEDAKKDVLPFINDTQILKLWNEDFFKEITNNLK